MLPALLFFVCMMAFYPRSRGDAALRLPAARLDLPLFHLLFQLMIFAALLESGTGAVHAINERIGDAGAGAAAPLGHGARLAIAVLMLVGCMLLADRFGLVALIADGYRALAWLLLAVYVAAAV